MNPYISLAIMIAAALFIALAGLVTGMVMGPYRPNKTKLANYECGVDPTPGRGSAARFPVKYYLTAMMFIIFDIEVVFLYPWVVSFSDQGMFGFAIMTTFMELLAVPYLYVWLRGGFDWD